MTLLVTQGCAALQQQTAQRPAVEQWDVFELSLPGPADGNPFRDVQLSAQFTNGSETLTVPGFYDGNGTYRVRFSPPKQGAWTYKTTSNRPELADKQGAINATAPTGDNHGPLLVHKTFHFAYADGKPYYQVGTTCYAWTHQTEELQEQTLKTLADAPFNKMRMCIFPKSYAYNANEPANYPFVRNADATFDLTRFDPANWQHLEKRIADLRKLGIEADLILFHPYDRWGFAKMDDATDDYYLRYAIARLSAYRNVWWSLANEYDFMVPAIRPNQRGIKQVEDFDRFYSILEKEDPYARLRGIHHAAVMYDHTKPVVTHASIQHRDVTKVIEWREKYKKPIVVDECRYEGNISQSWGNISGPAMLRQFWIGTVCGGYVGHGETLRHPEDILWWAKGGVLHGQSPLRIGFLRKQMESLPYTEMTPSRPDPDVLVLSKPGEVYLVYALKAGATMKLTLPGDRDYTVEALDTWEMKTEPLPPAKPGEFTATATRADYLLRITVPAQSKAPR
ncbi:MAG: DUF5060 domain-containing protein [Burkholderiales bacterium]|nr:DUF5060 domain-containing protein [Phycisphaerae bacterium]